MRKPLTFFAFAFSFFIFGISVAVRAATSDSASSFYGDFSGRIGEHIFSPVDLASQRLQVEATRAAGSGSWSYKLGFRFWDEAAYAANWGRYPRPVLLDDSTDFRLRDAYIQYKYSGFTMKVGSQQVVWGEAYGYFFSDIVNPKDLRDGAFGNLSDARLQTPMVNIKWVLGDFSVQGIAIPMAYTDILPQPGSDFLYPLGTDLPFSSITVIRQESMPVNTANIETGGRMSYLFGNLDLSVFHLSYFDRLPYYTLDPASTATNIVADEQHAWVDSDGMTATLEIAGLLFRVEGLVTRGRKLPSIQGVSLSTITTNDYIYVVDLDLPTLEKFDIGFQWSQDILEKPGNYLTRNSMQNRASIHFQRPIFLKQMLKFMYTFELSDGGSRADASYTIPFSPTVESEIGVHLLAGPQTSDFGRLQPASRAYAMLKCYFK